MYQTYLTVAEFPFSKRKKYLHYGIKIKLHYRPDYLFKSSPMLGQLILEICCCC